VMAFMVMGPVVVPVVDVVDVVDVEEVVPVVLPWSSDPSFLHETKASIPPRNTNAAKSIFLICYLF
jgi:hypothetical protein